MSVRGGAYPLGTRLPHRGEQPGYDREGVVAEADLGPAGVRQVVIERMPWDVTGDPRLPLNVPVKVPR